MPKSGMAFHASKGPIVERASKETPSVGDSMPGKCRWLMCTSSPTTAAIATRPCLSSACRKKASVSGPPISARPSGSKSLSAVSGPTPAMSVADMVGATAGRGAIAGEKPAAAVCSASAILSRGEGCAAWCLRVEWWAGSQQRGEGRHGRVLPVCLGVQSAGRSRAKNQAPVMIH